MSFIDKTGAQWQVFGVNCHVIKLVHIRIKNQANYLQLNRSYGEQNFKK